MISTSGASLWAAEEDDSRARAFPKKGYFQRKGGVVSIAYQDEQPTTPQTDQLAVNEAPTSAQPANPFEQFSGGGSSISDLVNDLYTEKPANKAVDQPVIPTESVVASSPDLASTVSKSNTSTAVSTQQRSPVSLDPRIRGYKYGQINSQADGAYYVPARQDLDTMLSKIDPGSVRAVNVIPGPYSSLLGPGFSYFDITTFDTPRYKCFENHFQTAGSYLNNGRQWYGRETIYGGGRNYGYRFSYGHRTGSDYRGGGVGPAGGSTFIPSSYNNRDFLGQFGYDLNPDQKLDFSYRRLDQTNTEYPGQFFDIRSLVTDGLNVRLTDEDPFAAWSRLTVQSWYNRTRFNGDTFNSSKRGFHVIDRVEDALRKERPPFGSPNAVFGGTTDGDVLSTGGRVLGTFGDLDARNLTVGTDLRFLNQQINEHFDVTNTSVPKIFTNLPRSTMTNPGIFAETVLPTSSFSRTVMGARVDFVRTAASRGELRGIRTGGPYSGSLPFEDKDLVQNDILLSGYLTNSLDLTQNWTANLAFGYAQRPPTLLERYADNIFVALVQNGFSRVVGDQNLNKERNYQVDAGLVANYDDYKGSFRAYHAWILDYITYRANIVRDPTGAQQLFFVNTPLATLSGCEWRNDFIYNNFLTPFATLNYVYGYDQTLHQALPGISPLQSRIGLWMHDPSGGERWGMEFFARIVDHQNRIGIVRRGNGVTPIEFPTAGFATWHLRAYWNATKNFSLVSGIDNIFDRRYLEHLSLRYASQGSIPVTSVLNPGFSPYFSLVWTY